MAAGGFKTFTTGEVLTSADTNNFLMQGVLVFDDAAARDAAITAPVEGQVVYLKDTNQILSYDGSTYVAVGGGSPLTTKGDLYTFSTVDARLPVGANGTILVADSVEATGLKWAAPAGGGKVLQVVNATTTTPVTVASATPTDSGLTASITPTLNTSKILVIYNQSLYVERGTVGVAGAVRLLRAGTLIQDLGEVLSINVSGATFVQTKSIQSASFLDSPATTSATTYKTQINVNTTANFGTSTAQNNNSMSSITLIEIGV